MTRIRLQLEAACVACLICVAGATFANAQTTRTATPVEKKSTVQIEVEQAGVNRSQPALAPSTEVRCRGGRDKLIFTTENARLGSTGETINIMLLTFEPSPYPAGARGEGLHPGECSWVDRPINGRFLIRFETPANAQLKQTLHGSAVDNSPTAAESYPDSRTIPIYMRDPNHYWSFVGSKPVNNFFVATGNAYFKPTLGLQDARPLPDSFKQRKRVEPLKP